MRNTDKQGIPGDARKERTRTGISNNKHMRQQAQGTGT